MRQPHYNAQYLESLELEFEIDGSAVTTSDNVSTGLLKGKHIAYVKKGTSADSNLFTITLKRPFGLPPSVYFQPITLNCVCRQEATPTRQVIRVRTLLSDLTSQQNSPRFLMRVFGTEGIREGNYR